MKQNPIWKFEVFPLISDRPGSDGNWACFSAPLLLVPELRTSTLNPRSRACPGLTCMKEPINACAFIPRQGLHDSRVFAGLFKASTVSGKVSAEWAGLLCSCSKSWISVAPNCTVSFLLALHVHCGWGLDLTPGTGRGWCQAKTLQSRQGRDGLLTPASGIIRTGDDPHCLTTP